MANTYNVLGIGNAIVDVLTHVDDDFLKKKNLDKLTLEELKKIEPKLSNNVLKVFDLKNSVNSKKSYGGTSFDNIKKMIVKYRKQK